MKKKKTKKKKKKKKKKEKMEEVEVEEEEEEEEEDFFFFLKILMNHYSCLPTSLTSGTFWSLSGLLLPSWVRASSVKSMFALWSNNRKLFE